jgi:hypothetical protein
MGQSSLLWSASHALELLDANSCQKRQRRHVRHYSDRFRISAFARMIPVRAVVTPRADLLAIVQSSAQIELMPERRRAMLQVVRGPLGGTGLVHFRLRFHRAFSQNRTPIYSHVGR